MLKWIPYPMVRVALFFIAGVLLAIHFPKALLQQIIIVSLASLVVLFFLVRMVLKHETLSLASGFIGLSAIFLSGYIHVLNQTDSRKANHLLQTNEPITAYTATVKSVPESKAKSWRVEIEVTSVKTSHWMPKQGRVLLYVSKKQGNVDWKYGDKILVRGSPDEVKPPLNPGEFDFKRFLSFRQIYHQQFLSRDNVTLLAHTESKGFIYYSQEARRWASHRLNHYIKGEQEQAIAGALILGVMENIDTELQNAYAASGALHVLSVSGLHVGIIYAIILFLFKPLTSQAWSRWVIAIVSLLCLWAFAFVTGLSPSVLRAVTMFSFIAVAKPFSRNVNIYNTLASSVVILLLYDPYLIMSVGFQLSYLAVLGIVYLQRPLYNLWDIENRVGDWIWQITCVSLAAQTATVGLGLLYFHQFPVYFLFSNLLVIPLSSGVLIVGVFLLVISFFSTLASWIGTLLEGMIQLLNTIVFKTEQLPLSVIDGIYINAFQCFLLMASLLCIAFLFQYRSIKWLYAGFLFILAFVTIQWMHFRESVNNESMIVYGIPNHHAMEWLNNGHAYVAADSSLQKDKAGIKFHVLPYRLQNGVTIINDSIPFSKSIKGMDVYHYHGKNVVNLHKKNTPLPESLTVDYLVISNNAVSVKQLAKHIHADLIILDGSNTKRFREKFTEQSHTEKMNVYDVSIKGAYILTD